jgi:hypothetical protein
MNSEDEMNYIRGIQEHDAKLEVELAIKQNKRGMEAGYNVNNMVGHNNLIPQQPQQSASPFVFVDKNANCTLNATVINQIQLTEEQFKVLLDNLNRR